MRGMSRKYVAGSPSPTSTEMLKEISEQVQAFGHGEPIPDDITLAIIENIADGDKINPLFKG